MMTALGVLLFAVATFERERGWRMMLRERGGHNLKVNCYLSATGNARRMQ